MFVCLERVWACTWNRAPRLMDMDHLAPLQTMMRGPSLGTDADGSCYVDMTIRLYSDRPAEKMNARRSHDYHPREE
jgi:hypothetical protein